MYDRLEERLTAYAIPCTFQPVYSPILGICTCAGRHCGNRRRLAGSCRRLRLLLLRRKLIVLLLLLVLLLIRLLLATIIVSRAAGRDKRGR